MSTPDLRAAVEAFLGAYGRRHATKRGVRANAPLWMEVAGLREALRAELNALAEPPPLPLPDSHDQYAAMVEAVMRVGEIDRNTAQRALTAALVAAKALRRT